LIDKRVVLSIVIFSDFVSRLTFFLLSSLLSNLLTYYLSSVTSSFLTNTYYFLYSIIFRILGQDTQKRYNKLLFLHTRSHILFRSTLKPEIRCRQNHLTSGILRRHPSTNSPHLFSLTVASLTSTDTLRPASQQRRQAARPPLSLWKHPPPPCSRLRTLWHGSL